MRTRHQYAREGRRRVARLGCAVLMMATVHAGADTGTQSATILNPNRAVSAQANLDFAINIGKFVFFRVGTGAFPTASGTVDVVGFTLQPSIPAGGVVPVTGNKISVPWNGAAPTMNASAAVSLPVEVRSNAGTISITATATTPLASGADSIPLSQIVITSSDSNLPAPLVPNAGVGPPVSVVATSFAGLVTQRSANWSFAYNQLTNPPAGAYSGQITFTATSL